METLAYTHLSLAHEEAAYREPEAYELKLFKGLNWKPPSSAWIGLIASVMTLLSIASSVQAAYVRTNGSPLNLRAQPAGRIVGSLPNGSYVSLSGRSSGDWSQLSNGRWASSRWISGGGGSGGGGGSNPGTRAYVRTKGDPLNVRSSPGGSIVGSLRNGSSISLSGRYSGGWAQLTNGNWVASQLISRSGGGGSGGGGGSNSYGTLQRGTSGQSVTNLQNRLRALGFYRGPITGYYGDLTESAVRRFQASRGIQVNGIAGPQTQGALYNYAYNSGSGGGGGGSYDGDNNGNYYSDASINRTRYEAYVSTSGNAVNIYSSPDGRVVGSVTNGERLLLTGRRSGFWVQESTGTWVDERYVRYSGRTL
jgi:peptidoglycan hydrolase-like protein with peptidoglycan-binding domain